jgi:hypothetical protein
MRSLPGNRLFEEQLNTPLTVTAVKRIEATGHLMKPGLKWRFRRALARHAIRWTLSDACGSAHSIQEKQPLHAHN